MKALQLTPGLLKALVLACPSHFSHGITFTQKRSITKLIFQSVEMEFSPFLGPSECVFVLFLVVS